MRSLKGQYFSFDVLIAGIIAIISFGLLFIYWQYSLENDQIRAEALRENLIRHVNVLTSSSSDYSILINNTPILKNTTEINNTINDYISSFLQGRKFCLVITTEDSKTFYGNLTNNFCDIGKKQAKIERLFIANDTTYKPAFLEFYLSE
jgi:hypothetical protein